jgi:H+/Cl- antiporter ClcA
METASLSGSTRYIQNFLKEEERYAQLEEAPQASLQPAAAATNSTRINITNMLFHKIPSFRNRYLIKNRWWHPYLHMMPGSLQQSVIVAFVVALVNGVACWLYYVALEATLQFVWHDMPVKLHLDTYTNSWVWIPLVCFGGALLSGLSVRWLGEPGDMAFTVACVHTKAYIPISHVIPMTVSSFFGITLAAASLGPEAPLVAICGALAGWISQTVFGEKYAHVVRKHTLMGMAGALAAFFGVPLGGSLFALEINSRFGVEYYEHTAEAIFAGELTLIVFRYLTGQPSMALWKFGEESLEHAEMTGVVLGGLLGLVGAAMAYLFALFHGGVVMKGFEAAGLLENNGRAVQRALVGAMGIITIGLLVPQTMFWSEAEMQVVGSRGPHSDLPHLWPTGGLTGYEMDTIFKTALIGFVKLAAISFSVAGGFRGGFIFPLFLAGGAVGRAIADITGIPLQLGVLCVAAGVNTAITRTALATTLVLTFLAGELYATPAVLMASFSSLFATGYLTFIKTQIARSDVDHSIFHRKEMDVMIGEEEDEEDDEEEEDDAE